MKGNLREALSRGNLSVTEHVLFHEDKEPGAELRKELIDFAAEAHCSAVLDVIRMLEKRADTKALTAGVLEEKFGPCKKSADLRREQRLLKALVGNMAIANPEINRALKPIDPDKAEAA